MWRYSLLQGVCDYIVHRPKEDLTVLNCGGVYTFDHDSSPCFAGFTHALYVSGQSDNAKDTRSLAAEVIHPSTVLDQYAGIDVLLSY